MMLTINKSLKILLFTNSLLLVSAAMLAPIYAIFVEEIGGDLLDASIAGSIFALFAGIITLFSGRLTDRMKEKEIIIIIGYIIVAIAYICFVFVNNIYHLFLVTAMIGIGEAIYSPAFDAVYTQHTEQEKIGVQWGLWESMYYFSTAVGAIIGGLLVTFYGFDVLFYIISFICILSSLIIYFTPRTLL